MSDKTDQVPEEEQGQPGKANTKPPLCTCVQDPFASLPPELKPKPLKKIFGLRQVTCPNCGFVFWTNRKSDLCVDCERKGVKLPEAETGSGG